MSLKRLTHYVLTLLVLAGLPTYAVAADGLSHAIDVLLDEIAPERGPARPPYQLARFDIGLRPEEKEADTVIAQIAERARERQTRLTSAWQAIRGLEALSPEATAKQAVLSYAFGDAASKDVADDVRALAPSDRLRWCKLLLAECEFDEAVRELVGLVDVRPVRAPEPDSDSPAPPDVEPSIADQALAMLAAHQIEREALAKKAQVWPLEIDLAAWLRERATGADGELIAGLRGTFPPPQVDAASEVETVIEEHEALIDGFLSEVAEPSDADVLDDQFRHTLRWANMTLRSHTEQFLQTDAAELVLRPSLSRWNDSKLTKVKLHSLAGGPIRFRLYRFDTQQQRTEATAVQLAARTPDRAWSEEFHALEGNNRPGREDSDVDVENLSEGHYILVAAARGVPTVAACSFAVNDVALYLRAGHNAGAVVAVGRSDGVARPNVPIEVTVTGAAKSPLDEHDLSRRDAAYRAGFLGEPLRATLPAKQPVDAIDHARLAAAFAEDVRAYREGAAARKKTPDVHRTFTVETGTDGIARFPLDLANPGYGYRIEVRRKAAEGDAALASRTFVDIDDFERRERSTVVVWVAQPVHRPGDTASFQGIVRRFDGIRAADHDGSTKKVCRVRVVQSGFGASEVLWEGECTLTEAGTFAGNFRIPDTAKLGGYAFEVDGESCEPSHCLVVAAFRTSSFRIELDAPKQITAGTEAKVSVRAVYHTGKPVAGAEIEFSASVDDAAPARTLATDADGRAEFRITVPTSTDEHTIFITASATDASGQHVAAMGYVSVRRAPFKVDVQVVDEPVAEKEMVAYRVEVTDTNGKGIEAATVVVDHLDNALTTDAAGVAMSRVPWALFREHRQLGVIVIASDRSVRAPLYWPSDTADIYEEPSFGFAQHDEPRTLRLLECHVPKRIDAGEKLPVRLRIDAPDDAEATIAISLENHQLLSVHTVRLGRGEHWLRFPTQTDWAPSVRVVAALLDPSTTGIHEWDAYDALGGGTCMLRPRHKMLTLDVVTDKRTYRPGERCVAVVRATNHRGEPASGVRISLGVVDEAIYGVNDDLTPDLMNFFYDYRLPEICRGNFDASPPEVGSWRFVRGPRYAWGYFRASAVEFPLIGRGATRHASLGRGLGGFGGGSIDPPIREDFRTTAYWTTELVTDADGAARAVFTWPDGISGWRFTARGVTANTCVGELRTSARTLLPLQAELAVPRGFRQGDQIDLPVVLHNNSEHDFRVTGDTSIDGAKRPFDERALQRGENARLTIPLSARDSKPIVLAASVKSATGSEADAVRRTLTPLPRGERVAHYRSGRLDRAVTFDVGLGAPALDGIEVVVRRERGHAALIASAVDELIEYPYGCVEQTMSRFMPAVIAAKALNDAGAKSLAADRLPEVVGAGLARLAQFQHDDGGWGWWRDDATNEFMTAYVVEGLARCKSAGYDVPNRMFHDAIEFLSPVELPKTKAFELSYAGRAPRTVGDVHHELYVLHALAVAFETEPERFAEKREALKLALQTLASGELAVPGTRVNELLLADSYRLLDDAASAQKHFEALAKSLEANTSADDAVVSLAGAIELATRLNPADDRIGDWTMALVGHRRGDGWGDTLATAAAVKALSAMVAATKAGKDVPAIVRVDGREVGRLIDETGQRVAFRLADPGAVTIEPLGDGSRDWYSAEWHGRVNEIPEEARPVVTMKTSVRLRHVSEETVPDDARTITLTRGRPVELDIVVNSTQTLRHIRLTWSRPCGVELIQSPRVGESRFYRAGADDDGVVNDDAVIFSAVEERDDAVHFFVEELEAGEHHIRAIVCPEVAGTVQAPRVVLEPMYGGSPTTKSAGAGKWRVVEKKS